MAVLLPKKVFVCVAIYAPELDTELPACGGVTPIAVREAQH